MAFPSSPTDGQSAVVNGINYVYTAATRSWARVSTPTAFPYTVASQAPYNPQVGDQWFSTTNDVLYEYQNVGTGRFWIDISGPTTAPSVVALSSDQISPFLLMGA